MIETSTHPADLGALKDTLRRASSESRTTALRTACYRVAWQWMALLAILFTLDILFGLPVWLRWLGLIGQIAFVLWGIATMWKTRARLGQGEEWAARVIEERHPEVDNAFIHAVQFERSLPGLSPEQTPLIQKELRRAERSAALVGSDAVDRTQEGRAARLMAAAGVLWAVTALLFSHGFLAVMPRLFAPWMDDVTPPWSVTRFDVRPPGVTIPTGENVKVTVKISGQTPDTLALMTRSGHGDWQSNPLDRDESGTYSITLESLHENTWFYVQANTGRSSRYLIQVTYPPNVTRLRAAYTYPEYTGRPPATETVGSDGIHGLATTVVTFQITSNRPLQGGLLSIQSEDANPQQIPLQVDPKKPTEATARMTISRPGTFDLSLTAQDGQVNPNAAHGKIVLEKDQRPNIWIASPGEDILVTPQMKVPVDVKAEDDNGVQNVEVHRIVNDLGDSPHDYPTPPQKKVEHELTMDLADLGVRPGDRITYYASAFDNTPGKPNIAETETFTMKVVTPQEFMEALKQERTPDDLRSETDDMIGAVKDLAQAQKQVADEMQQLQKQLAQKPGDSALQKKMAAARQEQKDLQQRAAKLAKAMAAYSQSPSTTPLEQALKSKLAQIASEIGKAAQGAMQSAQSSSTAQAAAAAKAAAAQLAQANGQMQNQIEAAIQHLIEILPLYQDTAKFLELLDRQGQIVLKARQFQETSGSSVQDKAMMQQLQDEQNNVSRELDQLQKDFLTHADIAQAHFPKAADSARQIAAEIKRRRIVEIMQSARNSFQQGDGPSAFESAENARQQMQAMVQQVQGGQSQCRGGLDIALAQVLGKSGLGQSLSQFGLGAGMGVGQHGAGFGVGGMDAGPGGQAGGSVMSGPKPYTASLQSMGGTGGDKKMRHQNQTQIGPGTLAPSDVEVMKNHAQVPPVAGDHPGNRYPPEYRKMISDYFKSVAEGQ